MKSGLLLSVVLGFLAGCAAVPDEPARATAAAPAPQKRCAEPVTGSRIPQCDRENVKTITRDELDRKGTLTGDPWPAREGLMR